MPRRKSSPARQHPRVSESRFARIEALLDYSELQLTDIMQSYEAQLRTRHVPLELCIKIKNYFENLRSTLDYLAHFFFEVTYPDKPIPDGLKFPCLWTRPVDPVLYAGHGQFPDLRSINRGLWEHIELFQPYKRRNKWLRQFYRITNDNKHWDLTAQQVRTAPDGKDSHLGSIVFFLKDEGVWIEYRFKGTKANALLLLEQAHTNIWHFVQGIHWHLP